MSRCVVVGAGMAGLTAARILRARDWDVVVVDKGRGVGGRMATRRIGEFRFDHGAQYFTARDEDFQAEVAQWVAKGWAVEWFVEEGEPRYCGRQGMSALAKGLAEDLEVRTSAKVESVEAEPGRWRVMLEGGDSLEADVLLLTPPPAQALGLCGAWMDAASRRVLENVRYDPCFALMVRLEGESAIEPPGFERIKRGPIAWIADNMLKGLGGQTGALTIHANPDFSRVHYEMPQDQVAELLLEAATPYLGSAPAEWQVHRWRYSIVTEDAGVDMLACPAPAPLVIAGDGFGGARIEGAWRSGRAAADYLTGLSG